LKLSWHSTKLEIQHIHNFNVSLKYRTRSVLFYSNYTQIPNASTSLPSLASSPSLSSVDKVDTKEVQQQRPQHEVRKRPLMRNAPKLGLVLGIRLDAQRRREYELADGRAEAGKEGIERLARTS
jgi:hypothetical protein